MKKIILTIIILILTILNIILFRNYYIDMQENKINNLNANIDINL